jgi:hypothetical protein
MTIKITKRAAKNNRKIKDNQIEEFGIQVETEFENKFKTFTDSLKKYPFLGSLEEPTKHIYGIQLTKHNRVFYRIDEKWVLSYLFLTLGKIPPKKDSDKPFEIMLNSKSCCMEIG